jgi:hypothetical protein
VHRKQKRPKKAARKQQARGGSSSRLSGKPHIMENIASFCGLCP